MEKIECWRGTDGDTRPVKCVCDAEFGWPNYCVDETGKSEQMFKNTHFLDINKAWKSIVGSVKAGVSLSGNQVKMVSNELAKAEKEAAKCCADYHTVRGNSDNPFADEM